MVIFVERKHELKHNINACVETSTPSNEEELLNQYIICTQKQLEFLGIMPLDKQGLYFPTYQSLDFAVRTSTIDGAILVRDPDHPEKILLTKNGSFRTNLKQEMVNSDGYLLLGTKTYKANLEYKDLEVVTLAEAPPIYAATTTEANLSINLKSSEEAKEITSDADNTAHFLRNIRIHDSLGTGHDLSIAFTKTGDNKWHTILTNSATHEVIINGKVEFNGDGTLRYISDSLKKPIEISWKNGALPSSITINWGTAGEMSGTPNAISIGKSDGLRQLDSDYLVDYVSQNGISPGLLSGVEFTNGHLIAFFSNGLEKKLYDIVLGKHCSSYSITPYHGTAFEYKGPEDCLKLVDATGKLVVGHLEHTDYIV